MHWTTTETTTTTTIRPRKIDSLFGYRVVFVADQHRYQLEHLPIYLSGDEYQVLLGGFYTNSEASTILLRVQKEIANWQISGASNYYAAIGDASDWSDRLFVSGISGAPCGDSIFWDSSDELPPRRSWLHRLRRRWSRAWRYWRLARAHRRHAFIDAACPLCRAW